MKEQQQQDSVTIVMEAFGKFKASHDEKFNGLQEQADRLEEI
ncbi:hypothetical protein [Nitrosomonas ureae]|uniref:Uncharacterized protein n=1 Tax=Nitrosomonas ureae TaxID=44577 RepID=A0A286ABS8_9PROT|nr:hypothetical protein [Nitrosomonas ureae]SOD19358.1 hypothetical protein SAMN06297164_2338 [Nitrosomonas ureae]